MVTFASKWKWLAFKLITFFMVALVGMAWHAMAQQRLTRTGTDGQELLAGLLIVVDDEFEGIGVQNSHMALFDFDDAIVHKL